MKLSNLFQQSLVWTACLGFLLPIHLVQADEAAMKLARPGELVDDVAIDAAGRLNGRVLTVDGQAMVGAKVSLVKADETIVSATTNDDGGFHFDGVSGGVYRMVAANRSVMIRAWSPEAAPPSARAETWIVGGHLLRGQGCDSCGSAGCTGCGGGPMSWLLSPWVIGAAIAAAIAIPLALDDDDGS